MPIIEPKAAGAAPVAQPAKRWPMKTWAWASPDAPDVAVICWFIASYLAVEPTMRPMTYSPISSNWSAAGLDAPKELGALPLLAGRHRLEVRGRGDRGRRRLPRRARRHRADVARGALTLALLRLIPLAEAAAHTNWRSGAGSQTFGPIAGPAATMRRVVDSNWGGASGRRPSRRPGRCRCGRGRRWSGRWRAVAAHQRAQNPVVCRHFAESVSHGLSACHAEGRGFESHQPLGPKARSGLSA